MHNLRVGTNTPRLSATCDRGLTANGRTDAGGDTQRPRSELGTLAAEQPLASRSTSPVFRGPSSKPCPVALELL